MESQAPRRTHWAQSPANVRYKYLEEVKRRLQGLLAAHGFFLLVLKSKYLWELLKQVILHSRF